MIYMLAMKDHYMGVKTVVDRVITSEIAPVWNQRGVTFRVELASMYRHLVVEVPLSPNAAMAPVQQVGCF